MSNSSVTIDFIVSSNLYFLKVLDMTNWMLIENKPSIIEITLPGYERYITKVFDKHKVNIFNSVNLDINCVSDCGEVDKLPLPDGIYKIKVIGSPSTFNKEHYYLKTDALQMEVDRVFIEARKSGYNEDFKKVITEIEFLVKGAESHLRFDDISMAGHLFQQAISMAEDIKNCKSCR